MRENQHPWTFWARYDGQDSASVLQLVWSDYGYQHYQRAQVDLGGRRALGYSVEIDHTPYSVTLAGASGSWPNARGAATVLARSNSTSQWSMLQGGVAVAAQSKYNNGMSQQYVLRCRTGAYAYTTTPAPILLLEWGWWNVSLTDAEGVALDNGGVQADVQTLIDRKPVNYYSAHDTKNVDGAIYVVDQMGNYDALLVNGGPGNVVPL